MASRKTKKPKTSKTTRKTPTKPKGRREPPKTKPVEQAAAETDASTRETRADDFTLHLNRVAAGDLSGEAQLAERILAELRRQARRLVRGRTDRSSVRITSLIDDLYMKLVRNRRASWKDRRHFFGTAAVAMRRMLVDAARFRRRNKRRPPGDRVDLESILDRYEKRSDGRRVSMLDLEECLKRLAERDPRAAEVFQLWYFLGLTVEEIVATLRTPLRTVERRLHRAKEFLRKCLG